MTDSQHLGTKTNLLQDQSLNLCQSRRADLEEVHRKDPLAQEAGKDQPAEGEDLEVTEDPEVEIEEEPKGADLALPEDLLKTIMDTAYM